MLQTALHDYMARCIYGNEIEYIFFFEITADLNKICIKWQGFIFLVLYALHMYTFLESLFFCNFAFWVLS